MSLLKTLGLKSAAPLFSIGADLLGGLSTAKRQKQSAGRQMEFQERMSNTAYQRAMDDMRKAGINPIMVSKLGGASTPTGAMAPVPDFGNIGTKAMQNLATAKQMQLTNAQIENTKAQTNLSESNSALNVAKENKIRSEIRNIDMKTSLDAMDVKALADQGLSPMQMKHTVLNQAGSEVYNKAKEIANNMGKQANDVVDTVYNYVLKRYREEKNWTIPFIVNNPHLIANEINSIFNKGEAFVKSIVQKYGWFK
jgi:hypothetical protein